MNEYKTIRRVNRRLNKTGIRLAMDLSKINSKWHRIRNVNELSIGEKINLYDILHDKILRDRYIGRILIDTPNGDKEI